MCTVTARACRRGGPSHWGHSAAPAGYTGAARSQRVRGGWLLARARGAGEVAAGIQHKTGLVRVDRGGLAARGRSPIESPVCYDHFHRQTTSSRSPFSARSTRRGQAVKCSLLAARPKRARVRLEGRFAPIDATEHPTAAMDVTKAVSAYIERIISTVTGMKVLLLDAETTPIISTSLTQSSLLAHEVYLTDRIDNATRDRMRHLKCIALLRPTTESIDAVVRELSAPKYASYVLFFTNALRKQDIERMAEADEHEVVKEVQVGRALARHEGLGCARACVCSGVHLMQCLLPFCRNTLPTTCPSTRRSSRSTTIPLPHDYGRHHLTSGTRQR